MSENRCLDCKYCAKFYVPPCECYKDMPKDGYVCTLFLEEANEVMWLEHGEIGCEVFSEREKPWCVEIAEREENHD